MNSSARLLIIGVSALLLVGSFVGGFFWLRGRPIDIAREPVSADAKNGSEVTPVSDYVENYGSSPDREYVPNTNQEKIYDERMKASQAESEAGPEASSSTETPTAPTPSDRDRDGLTDEQEATRGTNPDRFDTDADGLNDLEEIVTYRSDPLKADTDNDGFNDGQEVKAKYNPLGPGPCVRETCIP
ncbi:hypothetical protein IT407_00375 [Candidatus Uhrbacteria bacterium]|nr:hypothetical protein [Candidatus Uhrbacteria bacterium]